LRATKRKSDGRKGGGSKIHTWLKGGADFDYVYMARPENSELYGTSSNNKSGSYIKTLRLVRIPKKVGAGGIEQRRGAAEGAYVFADYGGEFRKRLSNACFNAMRRSARC